MPDTKYAPGMNPNSRNNLIPLRKGSGKGVIATKKNIPRNIALKPAMSILLPMLRRNTPARFVRYLQRRWSVGKKEILEALVAGLVDQAFYDPETKNRLAATQEIFDRIEGAPKFKRRTGKFHGRDPRFVADLLFMLGRIGDTER